MSLAFAAAQVPPWHMWGSTERIVIGSAAFTPLTTKRSQQLAKINYKRPDTWTFLLYMRILECDPQPTGAFQAEVTCGFQVTFGVGRSVATFPDFAFFRRRWLNAGQNPINNPLANPVYTTSVQAPGFIYDPATPVNETPPTTVTDIPAQDINVSADIFNFSEYANNITLEVGAFFAPKSHVRPDWFQDREEEQFTGAEVRGT